MTDDEKQQQTGPACYKCRASTRHRAHIADPKSQRTFDLYECTACTSVTWAPVIEKK